MVLEGRARFALVKLFYKHYKNSKKSNNPKSYKTPKSYESGVGLSVHVVQFNLAACSTATVMVDIWPAIFIDFTANSSTLFPIFGNGQDDIIISISFEFKLCVLCHEKKRNQLQSC